MYGMPKAAAKINAAAEILPLDQIATAITRAAGVPLIHQKKKEKESGMTSHNPFGCRSATSSRGFRPPNSCASG